MSTEGHITDFLCGTGTSVKTSPLAIFTVGIILLIVSCFYDTPLLIKWVIMNASPDRCFCCRRSDLHGRLIWLRG